MLRCRLGGACVDRVHTFGCVHTTKDAEERAVLLVHRCLFFGVHKTGHNAVFHIPRLRFFNYSGKKDREYFSKPLELLKMSVPSIAYALQNNLDFVALSNLEASVYQVTTQLKIPSTAIFMMLFLGRRFSMKRWVAILLLCAGVASVELDSLESEGQIGTKSGAGNRFVGIFAVFATCVTAGFAGVYFEKMLKDGSSTPFWIRNLQMYSCGVFSAFVGCFLKDYGHIKENGLFYGYNVWVLAIVLSLSLGGIYISLIMKHLDNLYKSFASSISIVAVTLLSLLLFENTFIGTFFLFGALTVCFALVLYNSVDQ